MNTAQNNAHQSSAFVERALARISELTEVAQDLTETLGLPKEACCAVLSGMAPTLIEELYRKEQRKAAFSSSQDISTEGRNTPGE